MNREDIIRMAREAGLGDTGVRVDFIFFQSGIGGLERFAALVAAAEREAKDELLAALQDLLMDTQHSEHSCGDKNCPVAHAKAVALKYDAIRARGKA